MENIIDMNTWLTWEFVGTIAGCVSITTLVTQAIKSALKWFADTLKKPVISSIPSAFISYVIAVMLINIARVFTVEFSIESFVLSLLNGLVVSRGANKLYDAAKSAKTVLTNKE